MDRRRFIQSVCAVGTTAFAAQGAAGADMGGGAPELYGVLVDTTMCAGCRNCELVCAEQNGLPVPDTMDESVFESTRDTSERQFVVVNRFETVKGEVFVRKQCLHCSQPACAAACLTNAMEKRAEGPVTWNENRCMGCRFCMVSCPFDMPKFEYHSAVPKIQKCSLCRQRLQEGQKPACVENCPAEALTYGKRSELLDLARTRIAQDPDGYVHKIYGEHEVGGTGWLYLASVPFEQLGFRTDLGTTAYPEATTGFLYSVPIILTLWPAFLLALSNATRKEGDMEKEVVL